MSAPASATPADAAGAFERLALARPSASAWLDQHLYSALSSLGRLWQRRGAVALTVFVLALALALPLLLLVAVTNLERFGGALEDTRELTVFLEPELDRAAIERAHSAASALPHVAGVALRSPEQGLEELRQLPGFDAALDQLEANPLPALLVVVPDDGADAAALDALVAALGALAGVDFVQYDQAWRERLTRALALARRLTWVLGLLLGIGALLIVGNTIRLDVAARAEEIAVTQLLGGSDGFVRRPFLYVGVWHGLLAALLALIGVALALAALSGPVAALAESYGSGLRLGGVSFALALGTIVAGIMLGWLGAWAACGRHLAAGRAE
jgi:cell division transport system permease protein